MSLRYYAMRMFVLLLLFISCCTMVLSRIASADEIICVASTPLSQGGEGKMSYTARRRKLIAYEGGAAQQWSIETQNGERVKMMLSCEPTGMKVSIYFSKRPCNSDSLNVYRIGFNASDIPLFQKEGVGPDEIIVQLEGASLQTKLAKSIDSCNDYEAVFQIPQTGVYRLKIVRLRKEWASVKNLKAFAPIEYEVFLDVLLTELLQFYMPEFCGVGNGYWVTGQNHLSDWPVTIRDECSEHQKRGVRITTNALLSRDMQAQSCTEEVNTYRWNRKVCYRDYHLDRDFYGDVVDPSNTSSIVDLRITDSNYLRRKILFIGDLHMRDLATLFRDKVCRYQHEEELKLNKASEIQIDGVNMPYYELKFSREANNAYKANKPDCGGSKEESCQLFDVSCTELTMMFIEAKYCEPGVVDKMKGIDYVVINCGHFPAQSAHYTFGQFRDVISRLLEKVANTGILNLPPAGGASPTTMFWLENTAQPLRQDDYIIRTQDWRTYHRLTLYDAIVKEESKRIIPRLLHIVPAFLGTFSVFDKLCNCGHYSDSAIYPQLMSFLDILRERLLRQ